MADHRNCYTLDDMLRACSQAWSKGREAKIAQDIYIDKVGEPAAIEEYSKFHRDHPGQLWPYDNPYEHRIRQERK